MNNLRVQGLRLHDLSVGLKAGSHHPKQQSCPADICPVPSDSDPDEDDFVVLGIDGDVARFSRSHHHAPSAAEATETAAEDSCQSMKWIVQLNDVLEDDGEAATTTTPGGNDDRRRRWFQLSAAAGSGSAGAAGGLVALSRGGAIVSVDARTGVAELVGEFENGIFAGAWSPDGEILVLVTVVHDADDNDEGGGGTAAATTTPSRRFVVLCMNAQWDVLAETDLEEACVLATDNNGGSSAAYEISVCWRPDASLFAVSSVDASDKQRKIRIYQRETLVLCAVGRNEDGSGTLAPNLLPPLSWAGSGCSLLLSTIQTKGKRQLVAFLEPNGLRHGQFVLTGAEAGPSTPTVLQLDWNVESDLLSVWLRDGSSSADRVQLWHRCNYHWYLKQEIAVPGEVRVVKFHPGRPYTMILVGADFSCREYTVLWDPSTVAGDPDATAFVIDGCQLNATHFEVAVIPPPMCARSVALPKPISCLVPSRTTGSVVAVAVHSDGSMSWVEEPESKTKSNDTTYRVTHVAEWSARTGESFDPTLLRGFCIVSESTAEEITMAAIAASRTSSETLVTVLLTKSGIEVIESVLLDGRVLNVTPWLDSSDGALIQLEDGSLMEFESPQSIAPSQAEPLLEPCPWIAALKNVSVFDDGDHGQTTRMVVGRTLRGRIYCHELLLTDAASSFFLSTHHEYLCYATAGSRCQLRFLSLFELHNFDPLLGSDENRVLQGYEPRNIERGARIVAVLPEKPAVVVQMPRGNLEMVHPRALVLRHSVRMIDKGEYANAFALLRKHRVDLNLIVDLDPVQFLDGGRAELFVEEVERIDHLNLFISSLQNGDAKVVMPKWWYSGAATKTDRLCSGEFDSATKVNRSCETLRSIMMKAEANSQTFGGRPVAEGHFLLPILSTFAKQAPPKLEDALRMIKHDAISKHPNAASTKAALFSDSAQSSIQYLAFLAEYELLFEASLGMYDFDLARAVARNSQMDPKAYLPLLKRYRELPENFARFEVDVRLKRFESALRHLHRSHQDREVVENGFSSPDNGPKPNDFNACARLIEEHGLFSLGLELFGDDTQRLQILLSLGDFLLREKSDPASALSVYLSCSPNVDHERAIHAARQCHDWKAFFTLTVSHLEDTAGSLLAREVAEELVAASASKVNRRELLSDAARVLLDYGSEHDVAMAVDTLLKGESWMEAKRNAQRHGRDDLVRKCIEAAVQYANATLRDLVERSESFVSTLALYSTSLKLRKESSNGIHHFGNDDYPDLGDDSGSLFSLASNASDMSKASGTSTGSSYSVTSSVISVKSTTTFTVTGNEERNRHKSKFNSAGDRKGKPKKKRGRKGRSKALPGSDQELEGLLQSLRSTCVDDSYRDVIADTIIFLLRNGRTSLAIELFAGYNDFAESINKAQIERRAREEEERVAAEIKSRKEGMTGLPPPALDVEREVDALACSSLPPALLRLLSFLPTSVA